MSWISLISKALFSCDWQQEKLGKQSIKEMPEHPHVPTRLGSKKARCNFHLEMKQPLTLCYRILKHLLEELLMPYRNDPIGQLIV
jgi:hypothetical protein